MILAGSRSSPLARAQVLEVQKEISVILDPVWVETVGDRDLTVSLRTLGKTDFFTRELDLMLLSGAIRIAIHSAKDLPDPLPNGLSLVALTQGVDPRDSLLLRYGDTLEGLPKGAKIATSSVRREEMIRKLRSDLSFIDLRGKIGDRLLKLESREADGVVVAEAALIRLQLTHLNRLILDEETTPGQGRLAILARSDDLEMRDLFAAISRA
jgi:hydroxymethylbilane synthase